MEPREIFKAEYFRRAKLIKDNDTRFVYYTSAETAMSIIRNREVWLRNARGMNDFSEVMHGFDCLRQALAETDGKRPVFTYAESLFAGFTEELGKRIDGWYPHLRDHTYLMCVSEHDPSEDEIGRLSMWRAYGGEYPVALVLNNAPFMQETDAFRAYAYPVEYHDLDHVRTRLSELEANMRKNENVILEIGLNETVGWVFEAIKILILCTKHPGFREEREWRVVYTPVMDTSPYVKEDIVTLDGVPQQIYKIPLEDIPAENFYGATVPDFVERILIGPRNNGQLLVHSFCKLLEEAGCVNVGEKVLYSGIPLRA